MPISKSGQIIRATLMIQVVLLMLIAAVYSMLVGFDAAKAAAFGGIITLLSTAYFAIRLLLKTQKTNDGYVIKGLGMTQLSKYAMIFGLLYLGFKELNLSALPLLITFSVTQMAYWLVLAKNTLTGE